MKKWYLLVLLTLTSTLQSCMVVGGVFRAGVKLGIYSVFIIAGIIIWVISKRANRRK
ncbi:MAG TPA: phosphatidate cytidylyltransferase [Segetibacter sp.]